MNETSLRIFLDKRSDTCLVQMVKLLVFMTLENCHKNASGGVQRKDTKNLRKFSEQQFFRSLVRQVFRTYLI